MEWWRKFFNDDYLKLYKHDEGQTSKEADSVIRMLQIEKGKKILDLACGFGRHSVVLAQKGLVVTGYDLSESFLKRAKDVADTMKVNIDLIQGDMRQIPFESEYDAVINMFTAFGFFEHEEEDLQVLKGVHKALKPGGQFLMDVLNREYRNPNSGASSLDKGKPCLSTGRQVFRFLPLSTRAYQPIDIADRRDERSQLFHQALHLDRNARSFQ